jgi:LytS/YehU family sensor histidine kinase
VAVHIGAAADASGWQLRVSDTGPGLVPGWREGVGLANVRERLLHHFGERACCSLRSAEPGTLAEVTIFPDTPVVPAA